MLRENPSVVTRPVTLIILEQSDGHLQSRQEPKPTPFPSHLGDGGLKPHVLTPTNLQVVNQKGMIRLSLARLLGDLISWCFWNSFELCKQQVLTASFRKKHNYLLVLWGEHQSSILSRCIFISSKMLKEKWASRDYLLLVLIL